MMTNCLPSNYHNSRVRSASNGRDDHVYVSAESYGEYLDEGARCFSEKYETYSQAVREERGGSNKDDSYRNSSYSFYDHSDECVDSPLDLSRDSSLFNGEKIIDSVGVKSEKRLQLEGSHYTEGETDNFDGATLSPLDLSKSSIPRAVKATKKIANKRNKKPEVRHTIYRCVYCAYVTNHKNNMRKHMFAIHGEGKIVECPKCGKLSKHKYSLAVHLSYCGKEPRFHCAYCPYKCQKSDHLQRHVVKHLQQSATIVAPKAEVYSPPPIQTANQSSPTPPSPKNINEESEVKVIKECPCCGKVFRYWGVMQRHYKICSGNCIRCKHCPYKTKDNATLQIHVNAVHPNNASEEESSILGVRVKTELIS